MRFAVFLFFLVAGAAARADTFTPPQGCTAYLTVQSANCEVEHHWTCEADVPGMKWHGEVGQNGLIFIGKVDDEAQWADSYFVATGERETLVVPPEDPASLTELFANGLDSYDFLIRTSHGLRRVVGFDRIVERDMQIDGVRLHRTEYDIRITDRDGTVTYASQGSEYVSEDWRRFFSGYGDITAPGAPFAYRAQPIEFIFPGEPGYLENTPKYGCDVLSTSMPAPREDLP